MGTVRPQAASLAIFFSFPDFPSTVSIEQTLEVRWFRDGIPPDPAIAWIRSLGATPESPRTDLYLRSEDPGLNVKYREGKLQMKRRTGAPRLMTISENVSGHREPWIKWSFPMNGQASDLQEESASGLWLPVRKKRLKVELSPSEQLRRLRQRDARIGQPDPVRACAELTVVESNGTTAWSVNIEAEGDPSRQASTLAQIAPSMFADAAAPTLGPDQSYGYAAWLQQLH